MKLLLPPFLPPLVAVINHWEWFLPETDLAGEVTGFEGNKGSQALTEFLLANTQAWVSAVAHDRKTEVLLRRAGLLGSRSGEGAWLGEGPQARLFAFECEDGPQGAGTVGRKFTVPAGKTGMLTEPCIVALDLGSFANECDWVVQDVDACALPPVIQVYARKMPPAYSSRIPPAGLSRMC